MTLGITVLVKFAEPLELSVFQHWVASFRRQNNRFGLWGNPVDMGPGKVHLYAVDVHLWQPIDLEITREHLYAQLPARAHDDTLHRLVANIQRFVDPRIETYVGDRPYGEPIEQAPVNGDRQSGARE